jgi:CTP synthase (UTP-ammonia lyase)
VTEMPDTAREKVSMFSHVDINQVICIQDVNNIYKVPMMLFENKVAHWLAERFSLRELAAQLQDVPSPVVPNRADSMNAEDMIKSHHIMQKWIELFDRLIDLFTSYLY